MIKELFSSIWDYLKNTDKIVLLFIFAELTRVVGFLPHIPEVIIYGIIVLYSLYCIFNTGKFNLLYVILLAYIPLEILVMSPPAMFSPWMRYVLFAIVVITCSGMCVSERMIVARSRIFEIICFSCAFLGVGSFFARFLGINYMHVYNISDLNTAGIFGGLTTHSMLLGPVAGVGTLYLANSAFKKRKKILWLCAAFSLASVLFASSRSAFVSAIAGVMVLIQLTSQNIGKFFKYIIVIFIVFACTMPLWQKAMGGLIEKQQNNVAAGSTFSSREDKWEQRMAEFKSSPVLGYGFVSVDPANKDHSVGMGGKSLEPGSSWLSVLSMTGIIGFVLIMSIYMKSFRTAYRFTRNPLMLSILTLLSVHMFAEGYIFFGGSFLAFLFWITIGVCSDQEYEIVYEEETDDEECNE